jgi:heptosyltransferase-2
LLRLVRRCARAASRSRIAAQKSVRTALALRAAGIPRAIGFATAPARGALHRARAAPPLGVTTATGCSVVAPLGSRRADRRSRPWIASTRRRGHGRGSARSARARAAGRSPRSVRVRVAHQALARAAFAALGACPRRDGYRCLCSAARRAALTASRARGGDGRRRPRRARPTSAARGRLMARRAVAVTNDSAPMHVASAAGVPQVAIFCATVPGRATARSAPRAVVVERDLACRPCGRHGGERCPARHRRLHGAGDGGRGAGGRRARVTEACA